MEGRTDHTDDVSSGENEVGALLHPRSLTGASKVSDPTAENKDPVAPILNNFNKSETKPKDTDPINTTEKDLTEIIAQYKKEKNGSEEGLRAGCVVSEGVKFMGLSDNDSICSSESDDELPEIPDGGWGWVVVAAAFLVSACADGLAFSFGLLHEEFTKYFNASQSKISLIGSLFIATPLLAGPIMSALVDRYGCRTMTIIGGVTSTIGFLLASISNSVEVLCITFGFITGLAMGILYVTAVVSVAFWFDKKRNLAVSLGACGIGFGTLIYSPMTRYFIDEYQWRGAIVLLAGTLLNMCVCGALMRDPDWLIMEQRKLRKKSKKSISSGSLSSRSFGNESTFLGPSELKTLMKSGESPEYILKTLVTSIAKAEELDATTKMNSETSQKKTHSVIHLPTFLKQSEKVPAEVIEKLSANKRLYNIILENYPSLLAIRSHSELQLPTVEQLPDPKAQPVTMSLKLKLTKSHKKADKKLETVPEIVIEPSPEKKTEGVLKKSQKGRRDWLTRQISTDHHYLRGIRIYRNTITHRGAMMNIPRYKLRASSCPNIYRNSMWSLSSEEDEMKWNEKLWSVTKTTFDFHMFSEFHFLMFNLGSLLLSVWFIVPYFYLVSFMTAAATPGGPTMISIIGIASSIGIVALGWAGDQPWMNVTKTYAACLLVCGASVALYPVFIHSFWLLAVNSAVFGLSFASSYSYTPTILVELMPLERFTVAYGLILLSQGIGHLVGPPLAGLLYDVTGAWDLTFYMAGLFLAVSGLCVGVVPYTRDFRLCGSAPLLKEAEADRSSQSTPAVSRRSQPD